MKRIKYLIGLLICFLFVSTGHGQVKEIPGLKMSKRQARLLNQVYDAQMNKEPVSAAAFAAAASIDHGLADGYCEDAAPVLMTPTFSGAPLTGGYWLSQDGSSEPWVNHTTGEFVPENVPSSLHGNFISCTYVVEDALGNPVTFSDYTKVFSLPDASYTLGGDTEICQGQTGQITLSGSSGSVMYHLYRDPSFGNSPSLVASTPGNSDGSGIAFNVSVEGRYTIKAEEAQPDVTCENDIPGFVDLVVNTLPSPVAANGGDVCLGGDIQLFGDPDGLNVYTWTNASGTEIGTSQDISFSSTSYGVGTHEFTLTVENAKGCVNTATTSLTVTENPSVAPSYNAPVCDGGSLVISANASGGSNTYITYTWTKGGTIIPGETGATLTIDPAGVADSDTYGVIVEDDNGCTSIEETVVVTIQALPVPTINGDANETSTQWCEGEDITLTGGGGSPGATYAWLLPNGDTQSTAVLTVNNADKATYEGTYTLTVTEGTCVNSLDHTIVINPKPEPIAANGGDVCLDEDISLTGNPDDPTYTYTWTNAGGTIIGTTKDITISSTPYGAGTHEFTLTIEDGNGCTESAITNVTVYNNPIVSPSYNLPVCDGGSLVISANASGGSNTYITYTWTKGGTIIPGETGATLTIDPAGVADSDTYGVIVEDDNGCTSIEETVVVSIQALPVPTINGDANETSTQWCEGEDITLTGGGGSPGATYAWLLPNGDTQSTAVLTVNNADKATYEGTYTLTVTEGTCVTSLNHNVVVNINPDALPSNGGDVCLGDNISLIGNPAGLDVYTWTNAGGTVVGTTQDVTVSTVGYGVGTHVFTLTVEDDKGCSGSATTSVDVNTVDATISVTAPSLGATKICSGTPVTFNGGGNNGSGNYTYEFHRIRGAADDVVQPDGASPTYVATGVDAPVDGDQFYVVVTDTDTGCTDTSDPITINVVSNPVPTLTITNNGGSPIICEDEQLDFEVAPADFARYEFSINGTPVQDGAGITFSYDEFVDGDKINVTAYTDLSANACYGTSTDITIQVNDRPSPAIDGDKVICINDTKIYTANVIGLGKGSYTWVINGGTPTGDTDEESVEVAWGGVLPYSISLNYVNGDGCEASTPAFEIITGNVVTAGLSADKTSICSGEDVTFTATGGDTYEFYIDGTEVVGHDGSDTYVASGLTDGQVVTVRAIDAIGCEDTHVGIEIEVSETPNPVITSGPDEVCIGETSTYSAEGGYINYVWTVDGGTILTDPALSSIDVEWTAEGNHAVKVLYESVSGGCVGPEFTLPVLVNSLPANPTFAATPSSNVIKGTDITFTAGGGNEYSFSINGTEVQAKGASNTLLVSTEAPSANPIVLHGDVVRVDIFNAAGCSVYQEITVGVYEGITPQDVLTDPTNEHCFGSTGITVYLASSQNGISYDLVRVSDGHVIGTVVSDGVNTVQWENVVGADPAEEYRVVGYYNGTPPTPPVDMTNSVFILEHPDIIAYDMSPTTADDGVGTCGTTQEITLSNSEDNITYLLLLNGVETGITQNGSTGTQLNFGAPGSVGVYNILARHDLTGCEKMMNGEWEVTGDPAIDTSFEILGSKDGQYCDDGSDAVQLTLSGSQSGYDYELMFNGASLSPAVILPGTGNGLDFGPYEIEGLYTVRIEHNGCIYPMTGSVNVRKVTMPVKFILTATDDGYYCENSVDGVELTLSSQENGIEYYVVQGGATLTSSEVDNIPLPVIGGLSGDAISLGRYVTEESYFVNAVVPGVGCTTPTDEVIDINIVRNPNAVTLLGNTEFCDGGSEVLYINNPQTDVDYILYKDGSDSGIAAVPVGTPVSRYEWTVIEEGNYKVVANTTNPIVCGATESNEVTMTVTPLPDPKTVNVIDGTDCQNGTVFTLLEPDAGVTYYVANADTDIKLGGAGYEFTSVDGSEVSFEFAPIVDSNGNYKVVAVNGGCPLDIFGPYNVSISGVVGKKKLVYPDAICEGDGGVVIGIEDPDDVIYELYSEKDPTNPVSTLVPNPSYSDDPIYFPELVINEGAYYVMGIDPADPVNGCRNDMGEHIPVKFNRLPVAYRIESSGSICVDTDGTILSPAEISVEGSETNYTYSLIYTDNDGDKSVVDTWVGDGSKFSFTNIITVGNYTVYAKSPDGCTSSMKGEVNVFESNGLSNQVTTSNRYTYCSNEVGAEIILTDQEYGVTYEVRDEDGLPLSPPVTAIGEMSGSELILGILPAGRYTIYGYVGAEACESQINDQNVVVVTSTPAKPILTSSAYSYCFYEEGAVVGLASTESGVDYYLVDNSDGSRVDFISGDTGNTQFYKYVPEGSYSVLAKSFNSGCTYMSDNFTVDAFEPIETFSITVGKPNSEEGMKVIPEGAIGVGTVNVDSIGMDMSTELVTYTLYKDDVPYTGYFRNGMGDAFVYAGAIKDAGIYTIKASENGCQINMDGMVRIEETPLIAFDDFMVLNNGLSEKRDTVHFNDILERTVLDIVVPPSKENPPANANIKFSLVDSLNVPDSKDFPPNDEVNGYKAISAYTSVPNNKFTIDEDTGVLKFVKTPSFYGVDSVSYWIYNTEHTHRFDRATVHIFVGNVDMDEESNLLIPNAFSPNSDNINDRFVISGSFGDSVESVEESKLEVFNRWGTVVYRSKGTNYGEDDTWWDGTANAGAMVSLGDKLPSGTYFYVYTITINDSDTGIKTKEFSGFIELRR